MSIDGSTGNVYIGKIKKPLRAEVTASCNSHCSGRTKSEV
jgi:hypothetical protein